MVWIALQATIYHIALLKTEPTPPLLLLIFVFVASLFVAGKTAEPSVADINAVLFIYGVLALLFSPFTADVVVIALFAIYLQGWSETTAHTHINSNGADAGANRVEGEGSTAL
jgi:hypothetical protein